MTERVNKQQIIAPRAANNDIVVQYFSPFLRRLDYLQLHMAALWTVCDASLLRTACKYVKSATLAQSASASSIESVSRLRYEANETGSTPARITCEA